MNLITLTNPRANAAEAYRTLRTNLMFSNKGKPLHTIMLTAASENDDKSAAVSNLAVTFAQAGHKTILVDADLRRPSLKDIWPGDNDKGLMTMMQEDTALSNPPLTTTEIDNLSLLHTGPLPDVPADVLSNPRLNEIIGLLKARADYILFDAPPVLVATDAALLASKVDGVVMVARAGHTRRDHIARAQQALQRVDVNLLGSILTNAPRERNKRY
jgi:capsular exopolysaccharide synthesis family protein